MTMTNMTLDPAWPLMTSQYIDIQARKPYLDFSYGFGVQMEDIRTLRPGFYTEFRYKSREHSGLAWGAIFGKVTKYKEMHIFPKGACPNIPEMLIFQKQKPLRELHNRGDLLKTNLHNKISFLR